MSLMIKYDVPLLKYNTKLNEIIYFLSRYRVFPIYRRTHHVDAPPTMQFAFHNSINVPLGCRSGGGSSISRSSSISRQQQQQQQQQSGKHRLLLLLLLSADAATAADAAAAATATT